jgi:hypothetical protein
MKDVLNFLCSELLSGEYEDCLTWLISKPAVSRETCIGDDCAGLLGWDCLFA